MALWDIYGYQANGGNMDFLGAGSTDVSITDETTSSTSTVAGGDMVGDDQGDSGLTYLGTVDINGVTGYVTDAGGGIYLVYVPAGSSVDSGVSPAIPDNGATWDLTTCFLAGTMIATPDGERAVETLTAGDCVLTATGATATVRWVGRTTKSRLFADAARTLPVRIKAGALGESLPVRDLLISPGHAMLVDGVLVQAGAMVNGTSIVRETAVDDTFVYYHVETEGHDLLLAEGAAAESFLIGVDDMSFDNWAERPASAGVPAELEIARVKSARQLPASVRALIAARATVIAPAAALAA